MTRTAQQVGLVEVQGPSTVAQDAPREDECLRAMEQELDDDLCVLNIHHLVLLGRIARQLVRPSVQASCSAPTAPVMLSRATSRVLQPP